MAIQETFSFVAIVVLYRTAPDEAATLRTLAACRGMEACRLVVVVDHGPVRQDDAFARIAVALAPSRVIYDHAPRNPPLGAAYNAAIRAHLERAAYVLILDQDTALPHEFLVTARTEAVAASFPTLMAPHMLAGDRIASPCRLFLGWGRRWATQRPGWESLRSNTLINSGAWIHRRVFETFDVWYSETLTLYGTDTDFFHRLGRREARFLALPIAIQHDFSFDASSIEGKASKVDAMLAANRTIYASEGVLVRASVRCMNAVVRLKYAVQYRTLRFLRR